MAPNTSSGAKDPNALASHRLRSGGARRQIIVKQAPDLVGSLMNMRNIVQDGQFDAIAQERQLVTYS